MPDALLPCLRARRPRRALLVARAVLYVVPLTHRLQGSRLVPSPAGASRLAVASFCRENPAEGSHSGPQPKNR